MCTFFPLKLTTALLESAERNDRRKYFKINLHERMCRTWRGLNVRPDHQLDTHPIEPPRPTHREKMYFLICMPNELACRAVQSDRSLDYPHEEILLPWLFKMHPVKILIRLHKCAGYLNLCWVHVWRYIFWPCGSTLVLLNKLRCHAYF